MDFDQLIDLEIDDPVLNPPLPKRRKKVIGLDDLLTDFYKEEGKRVEKAARKAKAKAKVWRKDDSDEEDQYQEASLCQLVDACENQIREIGGKEDSFSWGYVSLETYNEEIQCWMHSCLVAEIPTSCGFSRAQELRTLAAFNQQ